MADSFSSIKHLTQRHRTQFLFIHFGVVGFIGTEAFFSGIQMRESADNNRLKLYATLHRNLSNMNSYIGSV